MNKKYQVFISSTYEDLKEERTAVMQCLLDNNCIPVGMEQFHASNMSQMEYIRRMLDDCDYYILILAGKYGSINPNTGVSYTEEEYDYARAKGIPVLSFVIKDIGMLANNKCEQTDAKKELLGTFREKVLRDKLAKMYTTKDSLCAEVVTAIHQCIQDCPAIGWVRGNEKAVITLQDIDYIFEQLLAKHMATDEEVQKILDDVFGKKAKEEGYARIRIGTEVPDDMQNGDLFIQTV